jgi:hypothetical protein
MRGFFNGWRRKVGCVALAMALGSMTGWIRSLLVLDIIRIPAGTLTSIGIESKRQSLCFSWIQDNSESKLENELPISFWMALDPSLRGTELSLSYLGYNMGEFGWLVTLGDEYPRGIILAVPYWSVTMPLTLLSACLILWKPRPKTPSSNQPESTGFPG